MREEERSEDEMRRNLPRTDNHKPEPLCYAKRREELSCDSCSYHILSVELLCLCLCVCAAARALAEEAAAARHDAGVRRLHPAHRSRQSGAVQFSTLEALYGFVCLCPAAECPAHSTRIASNRIARLCLLSFHMLILLDVRRMRHETTATATRSSTLL